MTLTSIGDQRTPGRPIEITFAADTGLPSSVQELLLIGHAASGGATGTEANYVVVEMETVADEDEALDEAETKFGVNSELSKMVLAAVKANSGGSTFPSIKCVKLAYADTGFGSSDVALTAAQEAKAEFMVSCYDGDDATTRDKLEDAAAAMSGAQRADNNQFGTFGVVANYDNAIGSLPSPDSQFLICVYLRDSGTPTYTVGELAAACAAKMAANAVPFNPLKDVVIGGVDAPETLADYLSIGAGLNSESVLDKGWCPLKVKPNGDVCFVRTVTSRITTNGTTEATSYYDAQDFQVLYYWRKTLWTRFSQPDFANIKASADAANNLKSEMIRLAQAFQDQTMFQAVDQLAKQFVVERSSSDRHRFDVLTPVNVIPGLQVIAGNISATTEFDELSI